MWPADDKISSSFTASPEPPVQHPQFARARKPSPVGRSNRIIWQTVDAETGGSGLAVEARRDFVVGGTLNGCQA